MQAHKHGMRNSVLWDQLQDLYYFSNVQLPETKMESWVYAGRVCVLTFHQHISPNSKQFVSGK